MTNKLEQLKKMTDVVADTGDIEAMRRFKPLDATTNPSLLLKAASLPGYDQLLATAKEEAMKQNLSGKEMLADSCDRFAVAVGQNILELIPGRISTEVDARLSFQTDVTVERARKLIGLYEDSGIDRGRILIKIASTWEGIRAAEQLERENIQCNLTLLFGFTQAMACADAGVFLISPFVGRIMDWYKANTELVIDKPSDDPGVRSVTRIYNYYKKHDYQTVVMGASFRNTDQIEGLAGCDRLTISPDLMTHLASDSGELPRQLSPDNPQSADPKFAPSEPGFRFDLNTDAMATEKLAQGIRGFVADQIRLEALINEMG